jgi:hypothetical protein
VSNNAADNNIDPKSQSKSRSKGPLIRIETAGDISEDKLTRVAAKFAEVNETDELPRFDRTA